MVEVSNQYSDVYSESGESAHTVSTASDATWPQDSEL